MLARIKNSWSRSKSFSCFIKIGIRFLKNEIKRVIETCKYVLLYLPARCLYGNREIYLVAERGTDARDNGYYMFRYIRQNHPEKEVYYVIDRASADYEKVAALGKTVQYRSLKHYLLFIGAKYKISTHIMGYSPDMMFYVSFNIKHRVYGKHIFLQHGVTKDNLIGLYYKNINIDIFICGAYPEYKYIEEVFGYPEGIVKYCGLARYDGLHDYKCKNQILIMPTWRVYLKTLNEEERNNSNYFKAWNSLLNNELLLKKLEEKGIDLIFYPHYEMQPYLNLFTSEHPNVKIADFKNYDVQTLLKESKMMITDFSSVFFDIAYMKKPCLYYQFDEKEFYSSHYQKGYFDYRRDGFGEVVTAEDELVDHIIGYIDGNFKMKSEHLKKAEEFFPLYDTKNCERIFAEIEALN